MSTSEQPESNATPARESRRARLFDHAQANNVPVKTILTTIFLVVLVYATGKLLYRLRDLILLLLVGGFIALILNPLVDRLERRHIRRGYAVLIVVTVATILFGLLAFAFGYPLVNAITHLSKTLPSDVRNAEHGRGWVGHLFVKYHVSAWIIKNSSKLVSVAHGLSKPALAIGKGAVSVLLMIVTLVAFVILLMIEAPKIRVLILDSLEPERAQRLQRVSTQISRAALGYVVGSLIMSAIGALVVFVTLTILHVPFAFLFALWVLLVDFLPQIGGALAGFPTVLFAFAHSTPAGIITAVVFIVYTLVQNHVLNPLVMSKAVRINPLNVFIAILVGAEVGSWVANSFGALVGVMLAIPVAAAIQVVVKEWWDSTRPGS
jgi:predicted PurR-regulated permease PerM